MLIPIGVNRPLRRRSVVTPGIIGACAAMYVFQLVVGSFAGKGLDALALRPESLEPWAFVSYAFLHDPSGPFHLIFNILFLWVFGPSVEDRLGRLGFLVFYLVGAAASGGAHLAISDAGAIGASGAIAGVAGAFLVFFPRTVIRTFCFFLIVGFINIPATWFMAIAIVRDLAPLGMNVSDGVAHAAHLGGYAFGIIVAGLLLATRILRREAEYDLVALLRHRARRKDFRAAREIHEQRLKPAPADPGVERLAAARASVSAHLSRRDLAQAAEAYRSLLRDHPPPAAGALSRNHQYELANHLFQSGDHALAAQAYQAFLDAYPRDRESPHIRLLLGTIAARYLNDPVRAKSLLQQSIKDLRDEASLAQAQRELADLA